MEKFKLGICCNFGPYPDIGGSVGGSEAVIAAVAKGLIKNYGYEVDIYAHNYDRVSKRNGVNLFPCPKGSALISLIAHNYSHIFVYSDSQWNWGDIVENIDKIDCDVSCALVGAYHMQSHPKTYDLFKKSISRFNLICHSKGIDYKWCKNNDLETKIIPNGVNLEEFRENKINFREKYNIKEKYIILSVSNFFFGKGFEVLPKIAKTLSYVVPESHEKQLGKKFRYKDFIILQCSNTVLYPYDKVFLDRTKKQSKGLNIRFLRDLPREDIVAAFNTSDVFLFPSKKEIFPLVLLESRASKLPWISMDVGNAGEVPGGSVLHSRVFEDFNVDRKGYKIVDDSMVNRFCHLIVSILENDEYKEKKIEEGQYNIEKIDWNNIVPLYHEVFGK